MKITAVRVANPRWVNAYGSQKHRYKSDAEKMELVIRLAKENVLHRTGGPFGAAIFRREDGRLISVGVNNVQRCNNSVLHAEIVAIMLAQHSLCSFTLDVKDTATYELISSCEPCAMCLGALVWSGVRRLVCGATRHDATRIGFEEGPVFPESYRYVKNRGIEFVRRVSHKQARAVLDLYASRGGVIYNGLRQSCVKLRKSFG